MKCCASIVVFCGLLGGAGCSDDTATTPTSDHRVNQDASISAADVSLDGALDLESRDASTKDNQVPDGSQDSIVPDSSADTSTSDGFAPALWGYISRSVSPVMDGIGTLYVGVAFPLFDPPQTITAADLSQSGSQVKYEFLFLAPGSYEVWAFLDDNSNADNLLAFADPGDLSMITPTKLNLAAGSTRLDLVLDKLEGAVPDAGVGDAGPVTIGALKGRVTSSATPTLDGIGSLYVSLHTALPPDGQIASTMVGQVDLSSPTGMGYYYLTNVLEGSYYLRAFLDDNLNVIFLLPGPDKDDLVHSTTIPIHITGGEINEQDVVLDQVMP